MTAAVMEDFRVTSDKLEEWKDSIPRAGPKYRLGMYFDTIHEIPEFDAVIDPGEGYQSTWETDTELQTDDEFGSFIFSKIDGDSASVICVDEDEATSLIERFKLNHRSIHLPPPPPPPVGDISPSNNRLTEATYENLDGEDEEEAEHVYESIEDCIDEYQLFLCNEEGSPPNESTPTHAKVTQKVNNNKTSGGSHMRSKRSNSLPFSSHVDTNIKQPRKYSDCTEYARLSRHRHHDRSKESSAPPLPPPNQPSPPIDHHTTYTQLFRLAPAATNGPSPPTMTKSLEHTRKHSPTHQQQQRVVLKHKGREYVLPLTDNKTSRRHSTSGASPKHNNTYSTIYNTSTQMHCSPSTTSHLSNMYSTISRRSPPRSGLDQTKDLTAMTTTNSNNNKKKLKHSATYCSNVSTGSSTCTSKPHLTLYGVL